MSGDTVMFFAEGQAPPAALHPNHFLSQPARTEALAGSDDGPRTWPRPVGAPDWSDLLLAQDLSSGCSS